MSQETERAVFISVASTQFLALCAVRFGDKIVNRKFKISEWQNRISGISLVMKFPEEGNCSISLTYTDAIFVEKEKHVIIMGK